MTFCQTVSYTQPKISVTYLMFTAELTVACSAACSSSANKGRNIYSHLHCIDLLLVHTGLLDLIQDWTMHILDPIARLVYCARRRYGGRFRPRPCFILCMYTAKPTLGFSEVCKFARLLLRSGLSDTMRYNARPQGRPYIVVDISPQSFLFYYLPLF